MSVKFPFHASKPWPTERTGCRANNSVVCPWHGHLHGMATDGFRGRGTESVRDLTWCPARTVAPVTLLHLNSKMH